MGLNRGASRPAVSDLDFFVHPRAPASSPETWALGGYAALTRNSTGACFDNQDFSVQPRGALQGVWNEDEAREQRSPEVVLSELTRPDETI